jgi:hypothetical protein
MDANDWFRLALWALWLLSCFALYLILHAQGML